MSRQQYPSTCLGDRPHDQRVSDVTVHFNGCLRVSKRRKFFDALPPESQAKIMRDNDRITNLRLRLETSESDSTAAARLRAFKHAMLDWSMTTGRPYASHTSNDNHGSFSSSHPPGLPPSTDVNAVIKAPVFYFQNDSPYTLPTLPRSFPSQHTTIADLLSPDPVQNPLLQPCSPDTIRYFHLPANNMQWIEQIIARYYNEPPPSTDELYLKPHLRRSRTRTENLLRPEVWTGQASFDSNAEIHARHMRPFCAGVDTAGGQGEYVAGPKNMVLFMPYLHWETDRGRVKSAEIVKEVERARMFPRSMSEVVNQAQQRSQLQRTVTGDTTSPVLSPEIAVEMRDAGKVVRRAALGAVFRNAAALAEAMDVHVEEQLMVRYLHAEPPLHPRRTLDQSYYGALKSTRARDRDQVVYRGTMAGAHECEGMEVCEGCKEDVKKVPRLIMVDQLWLWVLDEKTVISSFPRRFGKSCPDPSAVHKTLRQRLRHLPPGHISSAYDLVLLIVDECSRVFFDRARIDNRTPNLVELFSSAIRDLTYKQTAAFDQFLIYTHLASGDYKRDRGRAVDRDNSNQNTLLNINPEGNLLKEVKDVVDEIAIMMRIKEQQQGVMEGLVKHVRSVMMPVVKKGDRRRKKRGNMSQESNSWDVLLGAAMDGEGEAEAEAEGAEEWAVTARQRENAKRTVARADQLLIDLDERIAELRGLLQIATNTSAALKDILTLKQQQASVIEAREAVKQAQLTLKQGQSIMIFTIVTIIFLPLSFCVGFFGMNSIEFNSGTLPLATELQYMFPISAGIIIVALVLGFSHSVRSNSVVELAKSGVSLAWNTAVTWVMVKTGLYMTGRDMSRTARRLKEKEGKITGGMKAEVMRKEKHMEKMKAAAHLAAVKRQQGGKGGSDAASSMMAVTSGRNTPMLLSPYSAGPGSPFVETGRQGKGQVRVGEMDLEMGERLGLGRRVV